jgi:uncharacterized membrane protein
LRLNPAEVRGHGYRIHGVRLRERHAPRPSVHPFPEVHMPRKHPIDRQHLGAFLALAFAPAACVDAPLPADPAPLDAEARLDVQSQDGELGYEVVILAEEYDRSSTNAINNSGATVGPHFPEGLPGPSRPFLWRDGAHAVWGEAPAFTAADINNAETVVGAISETGDGGSYARAAVWHGVEAGFANFQALPVPEHTVQSWATGVNGPGMIVGEVRVVLEGTNTVAKRVIWHDAASLPNTVLEPLDGFAMSIIGHRINGAGYVTGANRRSADGAPEGVAVVWRVNGGSERVQPVSLPHLSGSNSSALGISDDGAVVGQSGHVPGSLDAPPQAVLWRYLGGGAWRHPINLAPSDRHFREAVDVTNRGVDGAIRIAGRIGSNQGPRAVVWTVDDLDNVEMQVLPAPPGFHPNRSTSGARAINEEGWIAGYAQDHGSDHPIAVLWKPLTEPSEPVPPPGDELVPGFTYSCGNGDTCHFTDTSTGDPTGWDWSMPGGSPAAAAGEPTASTTYSSAGSYTVTLEVSRGLATASAERTIACRRQGPNLRCR